MPTKLLLLVLLVVALAAAEAMTVKRVAVIGATGKLGRKCVEKLVESGVECRILTSSYDAGAPQLETIAELTSTGGVVAVPATGGVSDKDALRELVSGCQAVIGAWGATRRSKVSDIWTSGVEDGDATHAKQVNYVGLLNVIEACEASDECKRIVRVTGKGEDPEGTISILINMLGSFAKAWNYEGERALRAQSSIGYTIVRPGIMVAEYDEKDDAPPTRLC